MDTQSLPIVLLDLNLPDIFLQQLEKICKILPLEEGLKLDENKRKEIQGIFTYGHPKIDSSVLDKFPSLKVISNFGVGVDHIDLEAAKKRNIKVGNTPDVLNDTVADMAFALLLSVARNIVYGDSIARDPNVTLFDINWLGSQVSKTTIGIIGMGKIGQIIAKRALGFDMKVLYHNRNQSPEIERQLGAEYRLLPDLLKESDFVVLILPLNDSSRKLIGKEQLAMMKKTAFLINVARGGIVDTEALTEALKNKTIKGAALDVTDPEPLPRDHPLLAMKDNLVLTPHLGSATFYARSLMMNLATENLENGLNGNPLKQSPILL